MGRYSSAGAFADRSGDITVGGTAEAAAAARTYRSYLLIQAPSTNGASIWVEFGDDAVQDSPSIELAAGQGLIFEGSFVPNGSISINGATGDKFTVKEG